MPAVPAVSHPEPSSLSRWSRTAAVVMLVAFLLVAIVAGFGLWAFVSSRKAERARMESARRESAERKVEDLRMHLRAEVTAHVTQAAGVQDLWAWRAFRSGAAGGLVADLYRLQDGELRWVDPGHRLAYLPAAKEAAIEQDVVSAVVAPEPMDKPSSPVEGIEAWIARLSARPLTSRAVAGESDRFPVALGQAVALLERVRAWRTAPREAPPPAVGAELVMRALLCALEVAAVNRDRSDVNPQDRDQALARIDEMVSEEVAALPAGRERWAVRELGATLRRLERPSWTRALHDAVVAARRARGRDRPAPSVQLHHVMGEVISVILEPAGRATVLRLDLEALRSFLEAKSEDPSWETLGLSLRILDAQEVPAPGEVLIERPLVDLVDLWTLPFRAQVLSRTRVRDSREVAFYGGILLLAAIGIAVGGVVVSRLLTREVRLARLKADFVSTLSHELKTPVTSISLFAEMLQDGKAPTSAARREAYDVIAQESRRLEGVVNRMVDVARRQERGAPMRLALGDLNLPVERALKRFERLMPPAAFRAEIRLWSAPLPVQLDAEAIEDVVHNLLSNAWKYRRDRDVRVRVATFPRRRRAVLRVSDDGIGIPRRERRRIFETFYRVDRLLSRPAAGTGLGLALVRQIVSGHRGRIRVREGLDGGGTTFEIGLPRARSRAVQRVAARAEGPPPPPPRHNDPIGPRTTGTEAKA